MERREYFYTLTSRGELIHDGAVMDDAAFLDFFFKRIQPNTSGIHQDYVYYSPCGPEWCFVACADTPVVFTRLHEKRLWYAPSLAVEFTPRDLRFSPEGVLYHRSPVGQWGRVTAQVAAELSQHIHTWGAWYFYDNGTDVPEVIAPLTMPEHTVLMRPREGNACAGCGRDNKNGLHLSFLFNSQSHTAECWLHPDGRYMGSLGVMHGGYVAMLLDETMGKVLSGLQRKAPTAQLNIRYTKPVILGRELYLKGEILREEGRKNFLRGTIAYSDEPDTILAEAEALFLTIRPPSQS
ncbi:MAG: DUF4505 family protein [Candidatus Kapabacteria bacterium]|nr:DUF4505 family protein [Candidatus Kapabacteria bacterium]